MEWICLKRGNKAQAAYEAAATLVSDQLGLESLCSGIEDFGELDTFSFEERSFLRRFAVDLQAGHFRMPGPLWFAGVARSRRNAMPGAPPSGNWRIWQHG